MKVKKVLSSVIGLHALRHRQHKRLLHNAFWSVARFGPAKGLLMLGAMALGGYYMQKRPAEHHEPISDVGANI
jgi:hypothetical protein